MDRDEAWQNNYRQDKSGKLWLIDNVTVQHLFRWAVLIMDVFCWVECRYKPLGKMSKI